MIKDLWKKYKSLIMYAVFGGLTTVVNMASYYLTYNILHIPNVPSTVIAWVLAVAFAFVTNKLWVFDSPSFDAQTLKHEIPTFFGARLATGVLDVVIMYLAVDVAHMNPTLWKLISNVLVIIINYAASKLIIFKKNPNK
jgi:putative flippase GtrA